MTLRLVCQLCCVVLVTEGLLFLATVLIWGI